MINEASRKDVIWGYLAQFLNVGAGIIIIPVAIKYLSPEDMGLWYLFVAISSLAQLLEFGFQPTISRMVSYVYSGATELKPEGVPDSTGIISYQLLYDLIEAAKYIYRYVSFGVAFILLVVGSIYLNTFSAFGEKQVVAWLIFSCATIVNFYFTYLNGLVIGKGNQAVLYKITAFSKLLMLLTSTPLLLLNYGLMSMAVGTLVSLIATRYLLYRYLNNKAKEDTKQLSLINTVVENQTRTVWLSAWKLGITSLGAFLILRVNQFIASSYLGLKVAASYGLTVQVIGILSSVSVMYYNLNLPKINSLQGANNKGKIKEIVRKTFSIVIALYVLGCFGLIFLGMPLLDYMSVNTKLLSIDLLVFMLLMYGLELFHSISATYLTTLNKVPFYRSSIVSGVSILVVNMFLVNYTSLGLLGIIGCQFVIQLMYNNWYWPLQVFKDFKKHAEI